MERKGFLEKLKEYKEKNIKIESAELNKERNKKTIIEKMTYEIKNDIIRITSTANSESVEINLNTIREIKENSNCIILYFDNKEEGKIKISAI